MGILGWMVVGLIAGWLAGMLIKGGDGVVGYNIAGLIGGLLGGFVAALVLGVNNPVDGIDLETLVTALIGSMIVIILVRALPGRSSV